MGWGISEVFSAIGNFAGVVGRGLGIGSAYTDTGTKEGKKNAAKYTEAGGYANALSGVLNMVDGVKKIVKKESIAGKGSGIAGLLSSVCTAGGGIADIVSGRSSDKTTQERASKASGWLGISAGLTGLIQNGFDIYSAFKDNKSMKSGIFSLLGNAANTVSGIFSLLGNSKVGAIAGGVGSILGLIGSCLNGCDEKQTQNPGEQTPLISNELLNYTMPKEA